MNDVILDTNTLLNGIDLRNYNKVYLPIVVIEELDNIKNKRSDELSYKARKAIRQIEETDNVEIKLDFSYSLPSWLDKNIVDNLILGFAKEISTTNHNAIFLSSDINMIIKARALGIKCDKYNRIIYKDVYKGYKTVILDEEQMANHYSTYTNNYGLLNNEYLILKDKNGHTIDRQRWTDDRGFVSLNTKSFKSIYLGDIKAKDDYQSLAIDSLHNSEVTLLFGVAGSGKTNLSLAWVMQNIQNSKINKCVIIFNSPTLKNNQSLGFYPGDRNQKLLQTSLGGILSSKFGDMTLVESLINQGKLMLIPTSDIRGIEVSEHDCLFVTEAQNTDSYTMRTILQRPKEKCKVIIEGDMLEQQDIRSDENGMMRTIEVFKGSKYFSCVKLQNTYRSPISELAQKI